MLLNGSPIDLSWAKENAAAIIEAWYPGQAGGLAVGNVIAGKANPAGRLPLTFYRSVADLPPFSDYSMKGRTYRYFSGTPVYPFGYGLSYSTFEYAPLQRRRRRREHGAGRAGDHHRHATPASGRARKSLSCIWSRLDSKARRGWRCADSSASP